MPIKNGYQIPIIKVISQLGGKATRKQISKYLDSETIQKYHLDSRLNFCRKLGRMVDNGYLSRVYGKTHKQYWGRTHQIWKLKPYAIKLIESGQI